ncbi:MAG: GNAT family N-acetyltransferase [Dehalococcoidia bacterium]
MAIKKGDIKVRRMVDADLPQVNAIDRLLFGKERVPTWPFSFESYWALYHPELSFVAEAGGRVVGFIAGNLVEEEHSQSILSLRRTIDRPSRHRKVGWIDMIGIDPAYQHMGIGRGLVEAFDEECKRSDAVMRGIARESDERLRNFLASIGFKRSDLVVYERD